MPKIIENHDLSYFLVNQYLLFPANAPREEKTSVTVTAIGDDDFDTIISRVLKCFFAPFQVWLDFWCITESIKEGKIRTEVLYPTKG